MKKYLYIICIINFLFFTNSLAQNIDKKNEVYQEETLKTEILEPAIEVEKIAPKPILSQFANQIMKDVNIKNDDDNPITEKDAKLLEKTARVVSFYQAIIESYNKLLNENRRSRIKKKDLFPIATAMIYEDFGESFARDISDVMFMQEYYSEEENAKQNGFLPIGNDAAYLNCLAQTLIKKNQNEFEMVFDCRKDSMKLRGEIRKIFPPKQKDEFKITSKIDYDNIYSNNVGMGEEELQMKNTIKRYFNIKNDVKILFTNCEGRKDLADKNKIFICSEITKKNVDTMARMLGY